MHCICWESKRGMRDWMKRTKTLWQHSRPTKAKHMPRWMESTLCIAFSVHSLLSSSSSSSYFLRHCLQVLFFSFSSFFFFLSFAAVDGGVVVVHALFLWKTHSRFGICRLLLTKKIQMCSSVDDTEWIDDTHTCHIPFHSLSFIFSSSSSFCTYFYSIWNKWRRAFTYIFLLFFSFENKKNLNTISCLLESKEMESDDDDCEWIFDDTQQILYYILCATDSSMVESMYTSHRSPSTNFFFPFWWTQMVRALGLFFFYFCVWNASKFVIFSSEPCHVHKHRPHWRKVPFSLEFSFVLSLSLYRLRLTYGTQTDIELQFFLIKSFLFFV